MKSETNQGYSGDEMRRNAGLNEDADMLEAATAFNRLSRRLDEIEDRLGALAVEESSIKSRQQMHADEIERLRKDAPEIWRAINIQAKEFAALMASGSKVAIESVRAVQLLGEQVIVDRQKASDHYQQCMRLAEENREKLEYTVTKDDLSDVRREIMGQIGILKWMFGGLIALVPAASGVMWWLALHIRLG